MKRLYLSEKNRKIGGVCGGLGEYFNTDPTVYRILFVIATLMSLGLGTLLYIALWIIIPKRPQKKVDNSSYGYEPV